jgi:hypothetical protein
MTATRRQLDLKGSRSAAISFQRTTDMTNPLVMLAAGAIAALSFGIARAETITEKSGNSTATVTQEPGTNIKRKVIKTPDGQTIVQESRNSKVVIHQSGSGSGGTNSVISRQSSGNDKDDADDMACPDKSTKGKTAGKAKSDDDDDCDD